MVRTPRQDAPGRFHHIMNRAAGRQILFADRRDHRKFLSLLACAVRRGDLVIQAYCLLGTHFHLLACSPDGRLSYAMMRIQNAYARYRNRRSRRDGPLFRGRFRSKPVTSRRYWWTLIRYIDHNAVQAGLCRHPLEYPYGSARHYAAARSPRWLSTRGVRMALGMGEEDRGGLGRKYAAAFGKPMGDMEYSLIEKRLSRPGLAEDDLDELFHAPAPHLARWMARKIRSAGGRSPWIPLAAPKAVVRALVLLRGPDAKAPWHVAGSKRQAPDGWSVLGAGLLSTLACLTCDEVGALLDCHPATAARRIRWHGELVLSDREYAAMAGRAARTALDETFSR